MSLTVATWNINSVRLRVANVERFLKLRKPDVLCLQETKCPDEFFPHRAFEALGYTHRLIQGMKAYNGVAILSKIPFTATNVHHRCGKEDCRHIEAALDVGGDPILLDNLYIPAGGDIPDPASPPRVPARAAAASPSATSTWRRWSTMCGATSSFSRSSRTRRSRSTCSAG
jgi:exodeoxyribonuclease-3